MKGKTLLERVKNIFSYLKEEDRPVFKSELKAVGLSPKTAEDWAYIIEFIQSQPRLLVKRVKDNLILELENQQIVMTEKNVKENQD